MGRALVPGTVGVGFDGAHATLLCVRGSFQEWFC
jgi:hypothetical protein